MLLIGAALARHDEAAGENPGCKIMRLDGSWVLSLSVQYQLQHCYSSAAALLAKVCAAAAVSLSNVGSVQTDPALSELLRVKALLRYLLRAQPPPQPYSRHRPVSVRIMRQISGRPGEQR